MMEAAEAQRQKDFKVKSQDENISLKNQQAKSDGDKSHFIQDLVKHMSLVFNKIIYTINQQKKAVKIEEPQTKNERRKKKKEGEVIDLVKIDKQQKQMVKKLKKMRRKKTYQADAKPKMPNTPYLAFYQLKIKEWENVEYEKGLSKSKKASKIWKSMSQQEKRPYFQIAAAERKKHNEEMEEYVRVHMDEIEKVRMSHLRNKNKQLNGDQQNNMIEAKQIKSKLKGISLSKVRQEKRKQYAHRPKSPMSSFMVFYTLESKRFAQETKVQGKILSKIVADAWKKMTPQEKQPYEQKSNQYRKIYYEKMKEYALQYPDQIIKRKKILSNSNKRPLEEEKVQKMKKSPIVVPPSRKSKKKKEDASENEYKSISLTEKDIERSKNKNSMLPHKPKGAVGSYFHFYQKNMEHFTQLIMEQRQKNGQKGTKLPGGHEISKKASICWNVMPKCDKQPYQRLAKEDQERYDRQMGEYKVEYPEEYELFMKSFETRVSIKKRHQLFPLQDAKYERRIKVQEKVKVQSSDIDSQSQSQFPLIENIKQQ